MGYQCSKCGMWVEDNMTHYCGYTADRTSGWVYPWWWYYYPWKPETVVNRTIRCNKNGCIYFKEGFYGEQEGYCGNNSLKVDKDGKCRSCVIEDEREKTQ